MSGYASEREVRSVIKSTLEMRGLDPKEFSIAGIVRDAFTNRGYYGWGFREPELFEQALITHHKKGKAT